MKRSHFFIKIMQFFLINYLNKQPVPMLMNIAMFGNGYVGLVTGTCLANLGHTVICVGVNEKKVADLQRNILPIYEPGLQELVAKNAAEKRLSFTTDAAKAVQSSEVIFIAVGTPQAADGHADLTFVFQVAESIGKYMNGYKVIVDKSTVPVGTADAVREKIQKNLTVQYPFDLVSNPEFLREGEAIHDFMNPDRIVIGVESEKAKEIMTHIYKGIERTGRPIFVTDVKSSELIKYTSNAFLATKISFMNQIAQLCEKVGGDIKEISKGIGLDTRIGSRFLQAGVGYGGSCFPKDVQALIYTGKENNIDLSLLRAVEDINDNQKKSLFPKIEKLLSGQISGKTITLFGLSFKPKTDDIREAPALVIIDQLLAAGAKLRVYDPVAMQSMKTVQPYLKYCLNAYDAAQDSDCVVIVTEWDEFRYIDLKRIKENMKTPCIVDGRNIYDSKEVRALGFKYVGVGREAV
jgi:UDPglucose 6-dehydrogenase